MKLPQFFCLLVLLAFVSCRSSQKNIIQVDSMKVYMFDMMRADELYINILSKDTTANKRKANIRLYKEVLALHKISKGRFDSSYRYYEAHPVLFKTLIDSLDAYAGREKSKSYLKQYGQSK
ncbi:MAG: DUF4296 domain-containing protein [Bacteroidota bacterium]